MSRITLIRHGQTAANEQHLYCGSTDLPLSDAGIAQLRGLHYEVGSPRFVISGMKRTEQTLHLLFGDVPFTVDPELREIDFGIFEMHSYEQLKDDPAYQAWLTGDNRKNIPPQGESGEQMEQRVLSAFRRWASTGEDLVLITHGGVIAAILASLFPEAGKNRYEWQPRPGQGYVLRSGENTLPEPL